MRGVKNLALNAFEHGKDAIKEFAHLVVMKETHEGSIGFFNEACVKKGCSNHGAGGGI